MSTNILGHGLVSGQVVNLVWGGDGEVVVVVDVVIVVVGTALLVPILKLLLGILSVREGLNISVMVRVGRKWVSRLIQTGHIGNIVFWCMNLVIGIDKNSLSKCLAKISVSWSLKGSLNGFGLLPAIFRRMSHP